MRCTGTLDPFRTLASLPKPLRKVVAARLNHLEEGSLHVMFQIIYRKAIALKRRLLEYTMTFYVPDRECVIVVLLDLSAAVDHHILITRQKHRCTGKP